MNCLEGIDITSCRGQCQAWWELFWKKNYYLPRPPPSQHTQKQKLKQTNEQTPTLAYVPDPAAVLCGWEERSDRLSRKPKLSFPFCRLNQKTPSPAGQGRTGGSHWGWKWGAKIMDGGTHRPALRAWLPHGVPCVSSNEQTVKCEAPITTLIP